MPPEALTTAESEKVHQPIDPWADNFALKIVTQDFDAAAQYRGMQHDQRWSNADELYLGWVTQKYWQGTRIPRSSLGSFLVYEQVEALLPKLLGQIFSDPSWFEAAPFPNTTAAAGRATRDLMLAQAEPMRIREEMRRIVKSILIYGNGIGELGWIHSEKMRRRPWIVYEPVMGVRRHPLTGQPIEMPIGTKRRTVIKEIKEVENRPFFSYVALKDFYVDPNTPSPHLWDARFCATRSNKTVDYVDSLRGQTGFRIPDKLELLAMAKGKPSAQADQTKALTEAYRRGSWNPNLDYSSDPGAKTIEVIAYWTADRLVWVFNRDHVGFNSANPYGFIPFYNGHYSDVLDRFYAMGIADVLEGEQRLQQGIINGRVDELALSLHPQKIKKRGTSVQGGVYATRPDQTFEAEDPSKDFVQLFPPNVTQQAFIEIQASDNRAQRRTGVSETTVMGVAPSMGNSANRTATGVNAQQAASSQRAQYAVENIETGIIEPMLAGWHFLNTTNLDPNQPLQFLGKEGELIRIDPAAIINADIKFAMRASSRMRSKQAMMQVFPLLAQTMLNPQFLELLASQQKLTIDVNELGQILLESFDYKPRGALFRPLSQEEIQSQKQPSPDEQLRERMQVARLDSAGENTETQAMANIVRQIIASAKDHLGEEGENGGKRAR